MLLAHLVSSMAARRQMFMDTETTDSGWDEGHATFYGDMTCAETMEGACGYGDLFKQGYGTDTAALSTALFNNGLTCGACFKIKCYDDPEWCYPGVSIVVTATNFCPPNYLKKEDIWCNPPLKHFDLSMYRRVLCSKKGGVRFHIKGNPWWTLVLLYNVGGAGDIIDVKIKGSSTEFWWPMVRSWGMNWQTGVVLVGQSLSFQVTTSDGKMIEFDNVAPADWKFLQIFDGGLNF
ncbi:hypothetical protein V6N11_044396 [Hibiscus sabdariffa]|uniref:Expansin n=1 Tax=Hibiscus sabdariffa TaxID=183260 RepID=A0ABR2RF49_9ROSI